MGNWWEELCIFNGVGDTIGWESDGKQYAYFGESMDTNFPFLSNWWISLQFPMLWETDGKTCTFLIFSFLKYITGWESGWRNVPILWEKYEHQIPRFSRWFYRIFPCYGKLMGKPMHFPYTEHTTAWESNGKNHPYYWKSIRTNFPGFVNLTVFLNLFILLKID